MVSSVIITNLFENIKSNFLSSLAQASTTAVEFVKAVTALVTLAKSPPVHDFVIILFHNQMNYIMNIMSDLVQL